MTTYAGTLSLTTGYGLPENMRLLMVVLGLGFLSAISPTPPAKSDYQIGMTRYQQSSQSPEVDCET